MRAKENARRFVVGLPVSLSTHDRYYFLSKELKRLSKSRPDMTIHSLNELSAYRLSVLLDEVEGFIKKTESP
jgi:hypothetical protein